MLPFPPLDIHPANTTRRRRVSTCFCFVFHYKRGVHVGCRGDSRVYMRENFTLPECTCGLSRDIPHVPRANLFKVDAHLKNKLKNAIKVLNSYIREFVLTWSKQKFVSSTVAPGITIFGKGGLLAPEPISKSTMVIMSCQLLFIDFLASFCHFFGVPYQFLYTKNHLE
jgi:hypothetical protein